jgi:ATP-dependent phosphofructokinase / diphosphate-dependent phosphofructokinase
MSPIQPFPSSPPPAPEGAVRPIRRVGILFSGGPAPAANAVISSAGTAFLEEGIEVIGFLHGYSELQHYHPITHRLLPEVHYKIFSRDDMWGLRRQPGVVLGTSRKGPSAGIRGPADLDDPKANVRLRNVYNAMVDLEVDALISIGGDGTLMAANYLYEFQRRLPPEARRFRVIHLPKTIDNDYRGIDFTFGFFTAVEVMARAVQNLRADAAATNAYFIVETMGRKTGWVAYGVAIAGEACAVISLEDIDDALCDFVEVTDPHTGTSHRERRLRLDAFVDHLVDLILTREVRDHTRHGVIVVAEGLSELLPEAFLTDTPRDEFGHVQLNRIELAKLLARMVSARYRERTQKEKKVMGVQLGYEARCAPAHAFDIILGSQLGIGAYRALVEEHLDGHMVSASGQLDLKYVPFHELINPETFETEVRFISPGSDFHRLARFLETRRSV